MNTPSFLRRVIAGLLLVVFAFGITPKRTLHNFVANHVDGSEKGSNKNVSTESLGQAMFNCQCDNLVCESPFVAEIPFQYSLVLPVFSLQLNGAVYSRVSSTSISYGLRGPPVA